MEKENWKSLKGIVECGDSYSVSTLGNVRNDTTGKILKPSTSHNGYLQVNLQQDGKRKNHRVHRLVALAFIPNPDNKQQVNHDNGIKTDNKLGNLEWSTPLENTTHAHNTGLANAKGENSGVSKITDKQVREIKEMLRDGYKSTYIADKYNVSRQAITSINIGDSWSHVIVEGFEFSKGKRPKNTNLTEMQVIEIRAEYMSKGCTYTALANKFNVSRNTVARIVKRESWKHLP